MPRAMSAAPILSAFFLIAALPAAASDKTQGMAVMSAVVESDGTPVHMAGVTATERTNDGNFDVTFARNVDYESCAFSVTPLAGAAITGGIVNGRTLSVQIYTVTDGSFYNAAFSIIAFCHK